MLTKKGGINDVPQEMYEGMPKLENGKPVVIRTLAKNSVKNLFTSKVDVIYEKTSIPLRDTITDKDGNRIIIGIPRNWNKEQVEEFEILMPFKEMGVGEYHGLFALTAGAFTSFGVPHEEILAFLWLSNQNSSNEKRNTQVQARYEFIDNKKDAKVIGKRLDQLTIALNVIADWKPQEVKDFAASLNLDTEDDIDVLKTTIRQMAMSDIESFNKHYENPNRAIKSVLKKAEDKGIIVYDAGSNTVKWKDGGVQIITLSGYDTPWLDQMADWCLKGGGEKVYSQIEKREKAVK